MDLHMKCEGDSAADRPVHAAAAAAAAASSSPPPVAASSTAALPASSTSTSAHAASAVASSSRLSACSSQQQRAAQRGLASSLSGRSDSHSSSGASSSMAAAARPAAAAAASYAAAGSTRPSSSSGIESDSESDSVAELAWSPTDAAAASSSSARHPGELALQRVLGFERVEWSVEQLRGVLLVNYAYCLPWLSLLHRHLLVLELSDTSKRDALKADHAFPLSTDDGHHAWVCASQARTYLRLYACRTCADCLPTQMEHAIMHTVRKHDSADQIQRLLTAKKRALRDGAATSGGSSRKAKRGGSGSGSRDRARVRSRSRGRSSHSGRSSCASPASSGASPRRSSGRSVAVPNSFAASSFSAQSHPGRPVPERLQQIVVNKCKRVLEKLQTRRPAHHHSVFNVAVNYDRPDDRDYEPSYAAFVTDGLIAPMDLGTIRAKLYANPCAYDLTLNPLGDFKRDVDLVYNNAMIFNPPDHWLHKIARETKAFFHKIIAKFEVQFDQQLLGVSKRASKKDPRRRRRDEELEEEERMGHEEEHERADCSDEGGGDEDDANGAFDSHISESGASADEGSDDATDPDAVSDRDSEGDSDVEVPSDDMGLCSDEEATRPRGQQSSAAAAAAAAASSSAKARAAPAVHRSALHPVAKHDQKATHHVDERSLAVSIKLSPSIAAAVHPADSIAPAAAAAAVVAAPAAAAETNRSNDRTIEPTKDAASVLSLPPARSRVSATSPCPSPQQTLAAASVAAAAIMPVASPSLAPLLAAVSPAPVTAAVAASSIAAPPSHPDTCCASASALQGEQRSLCAVASERDRLRAERDALLAECQSLRLERDSSQERHEVLCKEVCTMAGWAQQRVQQAPLSIDSSLHASHVILQRSYEALRTDMGTLVEFLLAQMQQQSHSSQQQQRQKQQQQHQQQQPSLPQPAAFRSTEQHSGAAALSATAGAGASVAASASVSSALISPPPPARPANPVSEPSHVAPPLTTRTLVGTKRAHADMHAQTAHPTTACADTALKKHRTADDAPHLSTAI